MDAFERKYRSHGVNVTSEEVFEEPLENTGAKLARQAAAKTNDLAGHGAVLAQSFIDECVKVVAAGVNPVLVSKGIDKTEKALIYELDLMPKGVLLDCLKEWDIKRVYGITVDNATANTSALRKFSEAFIVKNGADALVLDGKFLHFRCSTHILNLIVKEGLLEIESSVNAIRNGIYFVRSSSQRQLSFERHIESGRLQRGSLPLDVRTRWNSTYLMLEQAIKFKVAFEQMEAEDKPYNDYFNEIVDGKKRVGPPSKEDWESVDSASMDAFERKYRSHGVNVTSEEVFEEPLENTGAKLARQAAAKTNDLAGHGAVLAQSFIDECVKVVAAGVNPVLVSKGIDKTEKALIYELDLMPKGSKDSVSDPKAGSMITEAKSKVGKRGAVVTDEGKSAEDYGNDCDYYMFDGERVFTESESCKVQPVGNIEAGSIIAEAKSKAGKNGVVVVDEGKNAENNVYAVEGIQFDNGSDSEYFITDYERMCVEYDNCKLLLVDHKITNERELVEFMEDVTRGGDPIVIIAEDIEQEPLDTLIVRKSRGKWNVASVKAPGDSGELKSQYLDDIAVITGATVIREEDGVSLDKAGKEVLGNAYKVVITKEKTTIVGDGTTHEAVSKRVAEIKNLIEEAEQGYEKETLNERLAKLSDGVAVIQVGGQTETERREKKLRFEAALNGTKGAVEEDIVFVDGDGGCTLLDLAAKVDSIKDTFENEEEKVGADIVRKALSNAGEVGSVVSEKFVRGSLEHAASAAKKFLMSDIKGAGAGNPMDISGWLLR